MNRRCKGDDDDDDDGVKERVVSGYPAKELEIENCLLLRSGIQILIPSSFVCFVVYPTKDALNSACRVPCLNSSRRYHSMDV